MVIIKKRTYFFVSVLFFCALLFGGLLGLALSTTKYIMDTEFFTVFETALPTTLLDQNGEIITQLAGEEKRQMINIDKLPQHMIDALIAREDRIFYEHNGFSTKALFRAFSGKLAGENLGGGSTLTQQIAGTLYCDRSDMSIKRKLQELWWALQMERRYSKNEILELYLNKIYFGGGTYGVDAACRYYFKHDATQITPAEAAILVIQLSNPSFYNPFDYPNRAMERQRDVLDSMVDLGFITKEEAAESFENYWDNFDYTRTSTAVALNSDDKAPWFSEYVRRELGKLVYGTDDIYSSGFTVHTTLDLKHQYIAQETMDFYIKYANDTYKRGKENNAGKAAKDYSAISELLALTFNIEPIRVGDQRTQALSKKYYVSTVNPMLDLMSLITGADTLKMDIVNKTNIIAKADSEKNTVEGTMISIENETGYITALVGGSNYEKENQFIRAVQAQIQPGSSFKPLYYSAAMDSKIFTPSTLISDTPVVFTYDNGVEYIPQNFRGEFKGDVQVWYALAHSMNIPSVKILDGIGFEAAIERSSSLLGIPKNELTDRGFKPLYPLGLGVCSVRPIEIVRAYSIFANGGKEVTPFAIRSVEDKDRNIIMNPERDLVEQTARKGDRAQVISPQNAYVMTKLMENTVKSGTLANPTSRGKAFQQKDEKGKTYTIPAAGKTGTTQNWADAWATCFTPYYTTTFWFGFDKPGESLGTQLTGSTLSGPAMTRFFKRIHEGKPMAEFKKPADGIIEVKVCPKSGKLMTEECGKNELSMWFLEGTEPTQPCDLHGTTAQDLAYLAVYRLEREFYRSGLNWDSQFEDNSPLTFTLNGMTYGGKATGPNTPDFKFELIIDEDGYAQDFNPFMD